MAADARRLAGDALADALRDSRTTTLARTLDLDDAAWRVPQRPGVNLVAWELGHLAWFAEFWILRGPHAVDASGFVDAARPPRVTGADALFDSARLAHADRWRVELPSRGALVATLDAQLDACIDSIARDEADDAANYFPRLALFHEDMHGEAFAWLRATFGLPAPAGLESMPHLPIGEPLRVDGCATEVGRAASVAGFSFDNEQPAQRIRVAPFEIDAGPVRNVDFLRFVEANGYDRAEHWTGDAGAWRARSGLSHPERWRRGDDGAWQARWFDRWRPLDLEASVVHVNAWEAEAWCSWAGRRLPSAAEWECAARDERFHWGRSVWEWTADAFLPYPGFAAGPYRDYSAPWFGDHRELRGGAFATHPRLHHPSYRNFFSPERNDVFAGFRTAAPRR
ncbi:MAG: selenoneine synthase SenA [Caldimonas sp.]